MPAKAAPAPAVDGLSIIVATYERPERLARCLNALALMTLDGLDLEVIVIDDGSKEPPTHEVQAVTDRLQVRLHSQENAGPAAARNTGAELARHQWLAFTDDDCTPAHQWAESMVGALRTNPHALIGGCTVNAIQGNPYSGASQYLIDALYRWHERHRRGAFWTSNNMACSRRDFLQLGGFDETFPLPGAEDRELGVRWQRSGGPLTKAVDAVVQHHHDLNLRSFWRQHHNYGRGACRYRQVLADAGDSVDTMPPAFYFTLLAEPFRHASALRAMPMSALIALSQIATAAGFWAERRQ